jgi:hypothetical protein
MSQITDTSYFMLMIILLLTHACTCADWTLLFGMPFLDNDGEMEAVKGLNSYPYYIGLEVSRTPKGLPEQLAIVLTYQCKLVHY